MKAGLIVVFLYLASSPCFAQTSQRPWGRPSEYGISFAFSHSGKIVALSNDTGLALWDLRNHSVIRSFSMPRSYCGYRQMVFAPKDSALIVVCCQWYQIDGEYPEIAVNPYTLSVYSLARFDLRTGALTVLDSDFHNSKVALASDGVRFAVLTSSGELSLHQIGHRSALHTAQMPPRREWPNVYTIAFSEDGKKIVIYWYGQLLIFDAHTLDSRIYIDDSLEWGTPEMLGSTVFLSRDPLKLNPILIDPLNGKKTEIQPPVLNAEYQYMNEAPVLQSLRAVGSGIVGNGNYLIARYEVRTTGVPIEGGARAGTDSLLITPLDHSNQRWGIGVEPSTIILDGPSIKGPSLLLTDGYLLRMVHLRSHKIETVFNSRP